MYAISWNFGMHGTSSKIATGSREHSLDVTVYCWQLCKALKVSLLQLLVRSPSLKIPSILKMAFLRPWKAKASCLKATNSKRRLPRKGRRCFWSLCVSYTLLESQSEWSDCQQHQTPCRRPSPSPGPPLPPAEGHLGPLDGVPPATPPATPPLLRRGRTVERGQNILLYIYTFFLPFWQPPRGLVTPLTAPLGAPGC